MCGLAEKWLGPQCRVFHFGPTRSVRIPRIIWRSALNLMHQYIPAPVVLNRLVHIVECFGHICALGDNDQVKGRERSVKGGIRSPSGTRPVGTDLLYENYEPEFRRMTYVSLGIFCRKKSQKSQRRIELIFSM